MKMIGLGLRGVAAAIILIAAISFAQSSAPHLDSSNMPAELNGTPGAVTGYVRDLACPYRNQSKEAAKPPDDVCVKACAKAGAPLGIITPDGKVFNVISHTMPDTDQRARLTLMWQRQYGRPANSSSAMAPMPLPSTRLKSSPTDARGA